METLALNWNFDQVTGSNPSGEFFVEDFSSGSGDWAKASRDNLLTLAGISVNNKFTVNVPTAVGGAGRDITVKIVSGDPSDGTANQVEVGLGGDNTTSDRVVGAINGLDSSVVKYGAGSGDVTNGIAGITAETGGDGKPKIKVTAARAGDYGNNITFTDVAGTMVAAGSTGASPATLADGAGGTDRGWLGPITRIRNTGLGYGFGVSNTGSISREFVQGAIQKSPETLNSSDMVTVRSFDDDSLYTKDSRPTSFFFAAEKSPYGMVSDQILKVFATILDFNNLIGQAG